MTRTDAPRRPLVRYHGGKWRIAPWIIRHMPEHRVYVEPYGGGASVLLQKNRSYAEIYNDLDEEIVNLFRVARDQGEALARVIELTPFARVIADITARPVTAIHLVHDAGQPISIYRLDKAFAAARRAAGADWQFRDLRAKTITDTPDLRTASQRAGHSNETITAAVYRRVRGHRVKPLD